MRESFDRIKSVIQKSGTIKIAIVVYAALLIGTAVIAGMQNYCQWTGCSLPKGIDSIDTSKVGTVVATAATATAFLLTLYNVQANFWRRREHVPHLTMTLRIQRTKASPSLHVITATLDAKNTGSALCEIEPNNLERASDCPLRRRKSRAIEECLRKRRCARNRKHERNSRGIRWKMIARLSTPLDVEPGESDQVTEDFIVPPEATTIAVATYVHNAGKDGADGWYRRTIHSDQEVEDAI